MAGVYYNTAAVDRRRRHATSASTARTTSRTPRASGRSTSSSPATSATRSSRRATPRSASTSATTATSPRARALLGLQRRRDRLQPVGHGRRALAVPVEARAAGARGRQRLLHRRASTASAPRRPGTSASSTARATSSIRAASFLAQAQRGQGRAGRRRDGPRPDRGGPQDVAVLPRPPARDVRRPHQVVTSHRPAAWRRRSARHEPRPVAAAR